MALSIHALPHNCEVGYILGIVPEHYAIPSFLLSFIRAKT